MRKYIFFSLLALLITVTACERVAPNYQGVLMQHYGKNGKSDFSLTKGRVNVMSPGTELFQVPLWEQRASFESEMHLQDADRTEYTAIPSYTYKAIENRCVDLVFQNKHLGSGDDFMLQLENNILEPAIYDIAKDISRTITTDSLTASGAAMRYENLVKSQVEQSFNSKGLELITFTCQLVPSAKVRERIDSRSAVNTNVSVLEQQILEQKKRNELAALQAQENIILSQGLTPQILQDKWIDAVKNSKHPIYVGNGVNLMKNVN